jgi:hypothetical protein
MIVNDETEGTYKVLVMAYFTVLPQHLHGETEENQLKTLVKVIDFRVQDGTQELPNMNITELHVS